MKLNTPTTLAALALIGAGGFMAGRASSPALAATAQNGPVETRSSRSASQTPNGGSEDSRKSTRVTRPERASAMAPQERLVKLESIMRGENALDRNRALLAFIDQLAPGDFEEAVTHFREL